ncbi:MAG: hypothetical protein U1F50_03420 [Rubrivivax sp.]
MTTLQAVVLVASGVGAYYAAADWSRGHAARADEDRVVAAAPAPARASAHAGRVRGTRRVPSGAAAQAQHPGRRRRRLRHPGWLPPPLARRRHRRRRSRRQCRRRPRCRCCHSAFVGMVEQGAAKPQAYLARGDTLLIVAAGDVIENNTYRVEKLLPSGVVFTYLPLGRQQTLNAPGATP